LLFSHDFPLNMVLFTQAASHHPVFTAYVMLTSCA
jgi:hypothetical protein